MKKLLLMTFLLLMGMSLTAQKYNTKRGSIHFEASVPLFEDVDARNNTAVALLNADTGELATVSMVKNFKFKAALMEEHFNENYAETAKYPKATFTGKILNFKKEELTAAPKSYTISGLLNFHGVNQKVQSVANIFLKDGKINLSGTFVAKPADYKVTIPKMVTKKIAENVNVKYQFLLTK